MGTWGIKNADGTWTIDGVTYSKTGQAGFQAVPVNEPVPIVWGDVVTLRQPLAIAGHEIYYSAADRPLARVLYSQWYTELANWQRSNSWLDAPPLVLENLVKATLPLGGKFTRFLGNYRAGINALDSKVYLPVEPDDPDHYPREEFDLRGAEVASVLGLAEGGEYYDWYNSYNGDPEEGYTRSHAITEAEVLNHCKDGDLLYLEVQCVVETTLTPEGGDPEVDGSSEDSVFRRVLIALYANLPEHDYVVELAWGIDLYALNPSNERMAWTDVVLTGGRAAICYDGPALIHVDALTGGDVQEFDLDAISGGNASGLLDDCISNRWIRIHALGGEDPRVWISGGAIQLACLDLSTNTVVWAREDEDTTWAIMQWASTYEGQSLLAARIAETYETIFDTKVSIGTIGATSGSGEPGWYPWPETVVPYTEARPSPQLAGGHSVVASVVALNPDTGEIVGEDSDFGTEPNGEAAQGFTQYAVTVDLPTVSDPASFENTDYDPDDPFNNFEYYPDGGVSATYEDVKFLRLADFFNGTVIEPFDNVTVTAIEGPSSPGVTGSFPYVQPPSTSVADLISDYGLDSFFLGMSLPGYTYTGELEAFEAWRDAWIQILNATKDTPAGAPDDYVAGIQASAAQAEKSRRNSNDFAIGEAYWQQRDDCAIIDELSGSVVGATQLTVVSRFYPSQRYLGTTQDGYIKTVAPWQSVYAIPPDSIKPAAGSRNAGGAENRIALEYAEAHLAWDGVSTRPYDGQKARLISPGNSGGTTRFKHRIFFQTQPPALPRVKSVAPPVYLAPAVGTGIYAVCGPRYREGEGLKWIAYNGFAARVWEQELDKPGAVPGISLCMPVIVDGSDPFIGVCTFYEYSGERRLCVLRESDGAIVHDDELPAEINDLLLEVYTGDGAIWAIGPDSFMGISN